MNCMIPLLLFPPKGELAMKRYRTLLNIILFLLIIVVISGLARHSTAAKTPNPQNSYAGPGRYEIENVASGKVLEVDRKDRRSVQQWSRTGQPNQQWDIEDAGNGFVYIRSVENGMALDIEGGRGRDGARVITSPQSGSDAQRWEIKKGGEGVVRFTSRLGKALDLPHGSHNDGTGFETWEAISQDNQRFRLVRVSGPVGPGSGSWGPENPVNDEKHAYDFGYSLGMEDYRAQLRRTYARHKSKYNTQWEEAFIEGYYDGYDAGRTDTNTMRREEKESYDQGFRLGQEDFRAGRRPEYGRHRDRFDSNSDAFFRRGYDDGYYSLSPH
jgi:hypothetical protein